MCDKIIYIFVLFFVCFWQNFNGLDPDLCELLHCLTSKLEISKLLSDCTWPSLWATVYKCKRIYNN